MADTHIVSLNLTPRAYTRSGVTESHTPTFMHSTLSIIEDASHDAVLTFYPSGVLKTSLPIKETTDLLATEIFRISGGYLLVREIVEVVPD